VSERSAAVRLAELLHFPSIALLCLGELCALVEMVLPSIVGSAVHQPELSSWGLNQLNWLFTHSFLQVAI
jgi:hypothetical protein